jgi:uncharacterized protein YeaO (DUF488 family)
MIKIKRVYEAVDESDGVRFFVEHLWPRGISKEKLHAQAWLKDISPSADLRTWFAHDLSKWAEFQERYRIELERNKAALQPILDSMEKGNVTLIYSAHDTEHNSALVLKSFPEDYQKS